VPVHTVSELLGHSFVAVTGDVYGHVSTEGGALPSSGSQQQWAGENVRHGYILVSKQERDRLGFLRNGPVPSGMTCCFPVGMTGFEPATP